MIFLNVERSDRRAVLEYLVNQAAANGLISEKEPFLTAVIEREKLVSTCVDFNVAIPHGKSSVVNEPFISYLSTNQAFQWDEREDDNVKYIFLIGVPQNGGSKIHLKYISQVSKKLMDEDFRKQLFECSDRDQAFKLLNAINKEIKIEQ